MDIDDLARKLRALTQTYCCTMRIKLSWQQHKKSARPALQADRAGTFFCAHRQQTISLVLQPAASEIRLIKRAPSFISAATSQTEAHFFRLSHSGQPS